MKLIWYLITKVPKELKLALLTTIIIVSLPAFSLVVIASSGLGFLANILVEVDTQTNQVQIFDAEGKPIGTVELSLNWPSRGWVSDEFGSHQPWRQQLGLPPHGGIDIAAPAGQPVTPFLAGQVIAVDPIDDSHCGIGIKLAHDYNLSSRYCHLSQVANLQPGQLVIPSQVIGLSGSSGTSTGAHLHFEIRIYGISLNPRLFLNGNPQPVAP